MEQYRGTTILAVRRNDQVVTGGDGQVSLGNTIMKGNARKVRRLYRDQVLRKLEALLLWPLKLLAAFFTEVKSIRENISITNQGALAVF